MPHKFAIYNGIDIPLRDSAMARDARSPSYPQMPLGKCVDLAERLYRGIHRAAVGNEEAQIIMGFSPKSGSGLAALSALKRYGLLEGRDPSVRLTDLALQILQPATTHERITGLSDAARKPALFSEVLDSFGGRVPADSAIRAKLIREKGFTASGAESFIRSFRETISFVEREIGAEFAVTEMAAESTEPPPHERRNLEPVSQIELHRASAKPSAGESIALRITPEVSVCIEFSAPITREGVLKLSKLLEVLSDGYPNSEEAL